MALTYGFYNSLNGDRKYNARHMSEIFDGIINDGVFMSVGTALMVTANGGMNINIGIGRAWFNHTWTYNDAIEPRVIEVSEIVLNRIDIVVLEINATDSIRSNSIKIIKGTPATNPVAKQPIKTELVKQYALAHIRVNKGVTEITTADITNKVGLSDTPFVTGILDTIDISSLIQQWGTEWHDWNNTHRDSFLEWFSAQETEYSDWALGQRMIFDTWFALARGTLTEDSAGNLLDLISELTVVVDDIDVTLPIGVRDYDSNSQWADILIPDGERGRDLLDFLMGDIESSLQLLSSRQAMIVIMEESRFNKDRPYIFDYTPTIFKLGKKTNVAQHLAWVDELLADHTRGIEKLELGLMKEASSLEISKNKYAMGIIMKGEEFKGITAYRKKFVEEG